MKAEQNMCPSEDKVHDPDGIFTCPTKQWKERNGLKSITAKPHFFQMEKGGFSSSCTKPGFQKRMEQGVASPVMAV